MAHYSVSVLNKSLAIGIAGVCLTALASLPAVQAIISRCHLKRKIDVYKSLSQLYRDQDGVATDESSEAFSDRFQRTLIALLSLLGVLASLTIAVRETDDHGLGSRQPILAQWLVLSIWVLLLLQATALAVEPFSTRRYELGLYKALSCCFLLFVLCGQLWSIKSTEGWQYLRSTHGILISAQIIAGFISSCTSISLPRRPEVYHNGKIVDQQFSHTFFGRIAFLWAGPLLNYAIKNQRLEIEDLPTLDYATRSSTLRTVFDKAKKNGEKLYTTLFRIYAVPLVVQAVLITCSSALSFVPQYCLLQILRSLEERGTPSWNVLDAWVWVFVLGASTLVSSALEAWLFWLSQYQLGIPVIEQLSAVVFAKSMRRKDVKGAQHTDETSDQKETAASSSAVPDDDEDAKKSRQATINHVAVDAYRIADFASYNCLIILTIVKLTITIIFLSKLIGWKSLGAGLLVAMIITPLNIYTAGRYASSQRALMKHRDRKMEVIAEALQGIRQIKFSAIEHQWERKIFDIREAELRAQWIAFVYDILLITIWIVGPILLSVASLGVYTLLYGALSASVAFTTISIFTSMEFSLAVLPEMIADFIEAYVSAGRIEKYLESAEKVQTIIPSDHISFENTTLAWPSEEINDRSERFMLQDLTIDFPSQGLSVISGQTGSGKSLILAAILGEADIISGTIRAPVAPPVEERFDDKATKDNWIIDEAIAFVAQVPWIENASIKDNILFGLPYDDERYGKVIFACALEKDFEMFPDGELTDIGANGINLSGGQKWRISFARALYSRAGILVMDDIYSALDTHTGRHLHNNALIGDLCQGRTRILVTHHVGLCLPQADYAVHLEHGAIKYAGSLSDLRQSGKLNEILAEEHEGQGGPKKRGANSSVESSARAGPTNVENGRKEPPKKFQQAEGREIGAVKLINYLKYLQAGGGLAYWIMVMFFFVSYAALAVIRSWWISVWTRSTQDTLEQKLNLTFHVTSQVSHGVSAPSSSSDKLWFYLGIYVALSIMSCLIGSLRYVAFLWASVQASRSLFQKLTYTILRTPLRWLDTVPLGRILNRFTADFNQIDSRLPYDFSGILYNFLLVLGIVASGFLVSPVLIVFATSLLMVCFYYSNRFLQGAREIKRLESNAKSPIFEQFGSALIGLGTIRAFGKGHAYVERMYKKIDCHAQAYWNLWLFNRWLGFRMSVIGAIFAAATAAFIVSIERIDASLAGFALSFALQYTEAVTWLLRKYANVELEMNAAERIFEYSDLEIENQGGLDPPAAWPTEGRLEVSDLVVAYAPELPPVLKGLSFTVEKNQRVGVVGRTGAGKSSLTLALFRFLEARSGSIYIDGIDVSKIKLEHLRSRLAIIPQDPVLFSGTVRSNLDPFNQYSDLELQNALERVHLVPSANKTSSSPVINTTEELAAESEPSTPTAVKSSSASSTLAGSGLNINIFKSLNSNISEGGLNLSQGQRQLLCLARAIVSRPKVMILDEATSAVDMDTDALIQQSIRSEFGRNSTTLLVIAHRLSTIADFDRILVLDAGKAVEFGAPKELMKIENGVFKSLVANSGEREALENIISMSGIDK